MYYYYKLHEISLTGLSGSRPLDMFNQKSLSVLLVVFTLENHCTRTAQSSRGGCSRRVHEIVYLADKKCTILVNILLLKIFIAKYCHL